MFPKRDASFRTTAIRLRPLARTAKLTLADMGNRNAMLADLQAHVSAMLVDVAQLMMFVSQDK